VTSNELYTFRFQRLLEEERNDSVWIQKL
jgi:hypothetical protein